MHSCHRIIAFTLVELLVVVTVIVILLSLLTPAMDRAIHETELAVCGAKLRTLSVGATAYPGDYSRMYPHRPNRTSADSLLVDLLQAGLDERPIIRDYIPIQTFLDPMVTAVNPDHPSSTYVQSGFYTKWYNVSYPQHHGLMGDRLGWSSVDQTGVTRTMRFTIIAGDSDYITNQSGGRHITSHPDEEGLMFPNYWDNVSGLTASYWDLINGVPRSEVDLNFAYVDNSVVRFREVESDYDDRMESVPVFFSDRSYPVWRQQLPMQ